jgi:hypothetical protein
MVQILPRPESGSDRFAKAFGNFGSSLAQNIPQELMGRKERADLSELIGQDVRNIRNPDFIKQLLGSHLTRQDQAAKLAGEHAVDDESYTKIKDAFGQKFADVWKASPTGARTALTQAALEARARGIDLDQMLGQMSTEANEIESSFKPPIKKSEIPDYKLNTEGMTPKEIVDFKGNLRKENTPIWKETINDLGEYKELDRDIDILDKINEKKNLPDGLEKLLIDPETGAPYPRGTIIKSPNRDVQQWGKTIARQATRAQTAFPGRVTNFDLAAYMRQFPGLFNTYDGRKIILKQMKLTNKANLLMSQALDKVYAKHKLSGITPEDAFEQARSMVEGDINDIDRQLIELASEGEILSVPDEELSGRMVDVIGPDGQLYEIDEREIDQLPPGYRIQ